MVVSFNIVSFNRHSNESLTPWDIVGLLRNNTSLFIRRLERKFKSVVWYIYRMAQLVRTLARKAKGPGSSPGPGYNFYFLVKMLRTCVIWWSECRPTLVSYISQQCHVCVARWRHLATAGLSSIGSRPSRLGSENEAAGRIR